MKFGSQLKTYGQDAPLSIYYRDGKKELVVGGSADEGLQITTRDTISGISLTFLDDELNTVEKVTLTSSVGDNLNDDRHLFNNDMNYTYINYVSHHESQGGNLHGTTQSASKSAPGSQVFIWYLHMIETVWGTGSSAETRLKNDIEVYKLEIGDSSFVTGIMNDLPLSDAKTPVHQLLYFNQDLNSLYYLAVQWQQHTTTINPNVH